MAGDWIPFTKDLPRKPEVLRIAALTGRPRAEVVLTLLEFWAWTDEQSEDGHLCPVSVLSLSSVCPQLDAPFVAAMCAVGWLEVDGDDDMTVPNFDHWMGVSAKKRLLEARRKRFYRNGRKRCPHLVPQNAGQGEDTSVPKPGTTEQNRTVIDSAGAESCSEPPKAASEPPAVADAVLTFMCVGRGASAWHLTASKLAEYRDTYPGVDVAAECRRAWQWCVDNPARRKTARGMPAFLSRWLAKAQDASGRLPAPRNGQAAGGHAEMLDRVFGRTGAAEGGTP